MAYELEALIARRFIARSDVKAIQGPSGQYRPASHEELDALGAKIQVYEPFTMGDLADHLAGRATYGHYLVGAGDIVKGFTFDIDLKKSPGHWIQHPDLSGLPVELLAAGQAHPDAWLDAQTIMHPIDLRAAWQDRSHPARGWLKLQMRSIAEMLSTRVREALDIDVVCAYSGNKGVHVYGLTGPILAKEAREAAQLVLASFPGAFALSGNHYNALSSEYGDYSNFTIEVFPKQDSVEPGHFGNLIRLPLGSNKKNPRDPTFFLDQRTSWSQLAPHPDPVALLTSGNPWKD